MDEQKQNTISNDLINLLLHNHLFMVDLRPQ